MKKIKPKTIRVTVDLTLDAYERLGAVQFAVGAPSKVDVVREALGLYEFLLKKESDGYELSLARDGEKPARLFLFRKS